MRRKDREVTDINEIIKIIEKCDVCRLGLSLNNIPYIVPMNFGYEYADGKIIMYFHGAKEGKKHDIIIQNANACFEMDCSHKLITNEDAAEYSMEYESVIGFGMVQKLDINTEKTKALTAIMRNYAKDKKFDFPERVLNAVTIYKIEADSITGKRHIK